MFEPTPLLLLSRPLQIFEVNLTLTISLRKLAPLRWDCAAGALFPRGP